MSGDLAGRRIGLLTAAASRLGGGVFEAVVAQAAMIHAAGGEARIFALHDPFAAEGAARLRPSQLALADVIGPAQIGFAPGLVDQLLAARLDCLHLHGIWMYPSRAATVWARRCGGPTIISPHGMLAPWITARGHWKKALARRGYERDSWRAATAFHALSPAEADDIERETGRADSVVIPNPGPLPVQRIATPRAEEVLYLGRIHPKKNLSPLLDAWDALAAARALPAGARLTIAGWGAAADTAALVARVARAHPSVQFIGPCFDAAKAAALARARYLILPSLSEGLPMAVIEAWAAGVPVLMSRHCHVPEGFAAGAAWDCGVTTGRIAASLRAAFALPHPAWLGMVRRAQRLAATRFAPAVIGARWAQVYTGLIAASAHPKR